MLSKTLFLCTGNYYRSRFAEVLFNHHTSTADVSWRANSRGLATDLARRNVGPISPHAIDALSSRGIALPKPLRFPRGLQRFELEHAHLIVAVKESEHRPMLFARFPEWVERVEYWHIDDVDVAAPHVALTQLERNVRELIARLPAR